MSDNILLRTKEWASADTPYDGYLLVCHSKNVIVRMTSFEMAEIVKEYNRHEKAKRKAAAPGGEGRT